MYRFFKVSMSDKNMSNVMFALIKTHSKLVNSLCIGIENYEKKQCKHFLVSIVIDIDDSKVSIFEELTCVKLQTSNEFKGELAIN